MTGHDYPIRHFEMMAELSVRLKSAFVLILEHHYHYNHFDSWWFVFEQSRKKFRIVFDGRDNHLRLEQEVVVDKSKDWQFVRGTQLSGADRDGLVLEVCSLIGRQS